MYTYKFRKNTTTSEKTPRITNSIRTAEPWFLKKPQATDLSHALGLVSWLPAAPAVMVGRVPVISYLRSQKG